MKISSDEYWLKCRLTYRVPKVITRRKLLNKARPDGNNKHSHETLAHRDVRIKLWRRSCILQVRCLWQRLMGTISRAIACLKDRLNSTSAPRSRESHQSTTRWTWWRNKNRKLALIYFYRCWYWVSSILQLCVRFGSLPERERLCRRRLDGKTSSASLTDPSI